MIIKAKFVEEDNVSHSGLPAVPVNLTKARSQADFQSPSALR